MATAYAALVSLMKLFTRIQHPTCPASFERLRIQPLFDKVSFLVDFLEKFPPQRGNKDLEALEKKMAEAAYAVEDIIEFYVVAARTNPGSGERNIDDNIARYSGDEDKVSALIYQDLEKVTWEVDFIIQEAKKVEERNDENGQPPRSFVVDSSIPSIGEIKMVGFDEHLNQLMEQLYTNELRRETLPVVGMGGIGKSTLARSVYNHPHSKSQFDVRAWVTISQEHNVETIVRSLLKNIGIGETGQFGDQLYQNLVGRKYLIVLDDIWSSVAWDEVNRFFPDNENGSRILLTTRLMNVALSVGSCRPYELKLLDDDKSWNLLREMVFEQDDVCPSELEKCGEKIAKSCKGLPLAIVVVGGLLKMSLKTLEYWQHVAENVNTLVNAENDGHCMKILSLSYHQLPIHLKPCFLYLATFPEDCKIKVSELVMLWVADGFLKPNIDKVSEEVALKCLNDLVSRNLIIVKEHNSMGRMKFIIMHDLVRDFCVTEAQKERFLYVRKEVLNESREAIESHRRIVTHASPPQNFGVAPIRSVRHIVTHVSRPQDHLGVTLTRSARSLVWFNDYYLSPYDSWLTSARVFVSGRKYSFINIAQLVNSRFLNFRIEHPEQKILYYTIPSPWNLETLIVHHAPKGYTLPWEIWELPHLRHLIFRDQVVFPDHHGRARTDSVLNSLQTLKKVVNFCFSDEVLNRIPNIKKLDVIYCHGMGVKHSPCFGNVVNCKKLETLACGFPHPAFLTGGRPDERMVDELKTLKLTTNLRKLSLYYSFIPWDNMSIVSSLPNLEVLKLNSFAFYGEKWNSVEGEFPRLKVLSIRDSEELVTWTAEDCCSIFPVLERLSLSWMKSLQEIPLVLGEVASLKSIRLWDCGTSVIKSAKEILEKQQEEQGTNDLTIEAYYVCKPRDKIAELENLADDNFQITFNKCPLRT